jgi:hypothetical protein
VKETGNFRGRAREDVDRLYPQIVKALEVACESEVTKYGDCPECKHRVPVTFPDFRGRVQAFQFLAEAGYGKPPETVELTVGLEADLDRWQGYLERMTYEERAVMTGFLQREVALQSILTVGDDH